MARSSTPLPTNHAGYPRLCDFCAVYRQYPGIYSECGKDEDRALSETEICSSDSAVECARPYVNETKAVYLVNLRNSDKVMLPFALS